MAGTLRTIDVLVYFHKRIVFQIEYQTTNKTALINVTLHGFQLYLLNVHALRHLDIHIVIYREQATNNESQLLLSHLYVYIN